MGNGTGGSRGIERVEELPILCGLKGGIAPSVEFSHFCYLRTRTWDLSIYGSMEMEIFPDVIIHMVIF